MTFLQLFAFTFFVCYIRAESYCTMTTRSTANCKYECASNCVEQQYFPCHTESPCNDLNCTLITGKVKQNKILNAKCVQFRSAEVQGGIVLNATECIIVIDSHVDGDIETGGDGAVVFFALRSTFSASSTLNLRSDNDHIQYCDSNPPILFAGKEECICTGERTSQPRVEEDDDVALIAIITGSFAGLLILIILIVVLVARRSSEEDSDSSSSDEELPVIVGRQIVVPKIPKVLRRTDQLDFEESLRLILASFEAEADAQCDGRSSSSKSSATAVLLTICAQSSPLLLSGDQVIYVAENDFVDIAYSVEILNEVLSRTTAYGTTTLYQSVKPDADGYWQAPPPKPSNVPDSGLYQQPPRPRANDANDEIYNVMQPLGRKIQVPRELTVGVSFERKRLLKIQDENCNVIEVRFQSQLVALEKMAVFTKRGLRLFSRKGTRKLERIELVVLVEDVRTLSPGRKRSQSLVGVQRNFTPRDKTPRSARVPSVGSRAALSPRASANSTPRSGKSTPRLRRMKSSNDRTRRASLKRQSVSLKKALRHSVMLKKSDVSSLFKKAGVEVVDGKVAMEKSAFDFSVTGEKQKFTLLNLTDFFPRSPRSPTKESSTLRGIAANNEANDGLKDFEARKSRNRSKRASRRLSIPIDPGDRNSRLLRIGRAQMWESLKEEEMKLALEEAAALNKIPSPQKQQSPRKRRGGAARRRSLVLPETKKMAAEEKANKRHSVLLLATTDGFQTYEPV